MSSSDVIVIGGGLVGTAVAYGLSQLGKNITVLDEDDDAFRASRGNFGLIWVHGKVTELIAQRLSGRGRPLPDPPSHQADHARRAGRTLIPTDLSISTRKASMIRRIAFIHTVAMLVERFRPRFQSALPDTDCFHMLDESVLQDLIRHGPSPGITRRIVTLAQMAADAGAELIVFTCSSTSPAIDTARQTVGVPILKIDDPLYAAWPARRAASA